MRILADTNIYYYLENGKLILNDVIAPGDELCISALTFIELLATIDIKNLAERVKIFRKISELAPTILPETDVWLKNTVLGAKLDSKIECSEILELMSSDVVTYDQIPREIIYWPKTGKRRTQRAKIYSYVDWNIEHERLWVQQTVQILGMFIPDIEEWFSVKRDRPVRKNIPSALKSNVSRFLKGSELHSEIMNALITRLSVPGSALVTAQHALASPTAVYTAVCQEYWYGTVIDKRTPKENDRWDIEFLLYINDSNIQFATGEKTWFTYATNAGFPSAVKHITL